MDRHAKFDENPVDRLFEDTGLVAGWPASRSRPPRAGGDQNHERLLLAADALIAVEGIHVSRAAIARKAGLGLYTFGRHFHSRSELLLALQDHLLTGVERYAQRVASHDDGLFKTLSYYADQVAQRPTLVNYWLDRDPKEVRTIAANLRLQHAIEPALKRAIHKKYCRPGVAIGDVAALLHMLTPNRFVADVEARRAMGRRSLVLLLAGIVQNPPETGGTSAPAAAIDRQRRFQDVWSIS